MSTAQNNQVELKSAEQKAVEQKAEEFEAVELLIDYDSVNIGKAQYKELVRSEVKLEIVEKFYLSAKSYELEGLLKVIFGPKGETDAQ